MTQLEEMSSSLEAWASGFKSVSEKLSDATEQFKMAEIQLSRSRGRMDNLREVERILEGIRHYATTKELYKSGSEMRHYSFVKGINREDKVFVESMEPYLLASSSGGEKLPLLLCQTYDHDAETSPEHVDTAFIINPESFDINLIASSYGQLFRKLIFAPESEIFRPDLEKVNLDRYTRRDIGIYRL